MLVKIIEFITYFVRTFGENIQFARQDSQVYVLIRYKIIVKSFFEEIDCRLFHLMKAIRYVYGACNSRKISSLIKAERFIKT